MKEDCELQEGDTPGVLGVPLGFLYVANNPRANSQLRLRYDRQWLLTRRSYLRFPQWLPLASALDRPQPPPPRRPRCRPSPAHDPPLMLCVKATRNDSGQDDREGGPGRVLMPQPPARSGMAVGWNPAGQKRPKQLVDNRARAPVEWWPVGGASRQTTVSIISWTVCPP